MVFDPKRLPPREYLTRSYGPFSVGDDWTPAEPLSLWKATKITAYSGASPIQIRLSRSLPPAPPTWDDPITLPAGPWSHVGPFGYWQFRNLTRGQAGTVYGVAYAE